MAQHRCSYSAPIIATAFLALQATAAYAAGGVYCTPHVLGEAQLDGSYGVATVQLAESNGLTKSIIAISSPDAGTSAALPNREGKVYIYEVDPQPTIVASPAPSPFPQACRLIRTLTGQAGTVGGQPGEKIGSALARLKCLNSADPMCQQSGDYLVVGARNVAKTFIYSASSGALVQVVPGATGTFSGSSIATGDLNGDQIDDIIVGSPGFSGGQGNQVDVYDGKTRTLLGTATPSMHSMIATGLNNERYGSSIAVTQSSSGQPLIAVGAPFGGPGTGVRGGCVGFLTYSTAGGLQAIPAKDFCQPRLSTGSLQFGATIAVLGDIDLDTEPDFAVGVPGHKMGTSANVGRVDMVSFGQIGVGNPILNPVGGGVDELVGTVTGTSLGSALSTQPFVPGIQTLATGGFGWTPLASLSNFGIAYSAAIVASPTSGRLLLGRVSTGGLVEAQHGISTLMMSSADAAVDPLPDILIPESYLQNSQRAGEATLFTFPVLNPNRTSGFTRVVQNSSYCGAGIPYTGPAITAVSCDNSSTPGNCINMGPPRINSKLRLTVSNMPAGWTVGLYGGPKAEFSYPLPGHNLGCRVYLGQFLANRNFVVPGPPNTRGSIETDIDVPNMPSLTFAEDILAFQAVSFDPNGGPITMSSIELTGAIAVTLGP